MRCPVPLPTDAADRRITDHFTFQEMGDAPMWIECANAPTQRLYDAECCGEELKDEEGGVVVNEKGKIQYSRGKELVFNHNHRAQTSKVVFERLRSKYPGVFKEVSGPGPKESPPEPEAPEPQVSPEPPPEEAPEGA